MYIEMERGDRREGGLQQNSTLKGSICMIMIALGDEMD